MRCNCPRCGVEVWMIHSERDNACVCPECLYRCYACQGDGAALTRDEILALRDAPAEIQAALLRQSAAQDAAQALCPEDGEPWDEPLD